MEAEGDSTTDTVNLFVCTVCENEKTYRLRKSLYKHLRSFHNIEPVKKDPQFECETCEKKFSTKGNLKLHAVKFHAPLLQQDQESKRNTRLLCSFLECDLKFLNHKQYRIHLQKDHKLHLETEEFCFGSFQEFEHWKKEMESQTQAFYTQDTAKATLANGNIKIYYNCHRSYKYISKGKNKRAPKFIGSNKINKACPARLDVEVVNDKSKVIVKFYKTHCGHENQIGRTRLDKNTRALIADKLKEGVAFEHILDSVRDSNLDNSTLERISLLTRKDLHNIVRDFSIKHHQSNKNSGKECINKKIVSVMELLKTTDLDDEDTDLLEYKLDQVIDILNKNEKEGSKEKIDGFSEFNYCKVELQELEETIDL